MRWRLRAPALQQRVRQRLPRPQQPQRRLCSWSLGGQVLNWRRQATLDRRMPPCLSPCRSVSPAALLLLYKGVELGLRLQ